MSSDSKMGWFSYGTTKSRVVAFVIGALLVLIFSAIIVRTILVDKPVLRYYLASGSQTNSFVIRADIDNWGDDYIATNGMSYQQAFNLVDSLNAELVRHPRLK